MIKAIVFVRSARAGIGLTTIAMPLCLFVALCFLSPNFFNWQNLSNVTSQITALLVVSLGELIVVLAGGIDLSVGAMLSLITTIVVSVDPRFAVPAALLAGVVVGLVNGIGVTLVGVHPLIMTIASMTFLQGLALLIQPVPGGTVPSYLNTIAASTVIGLPAAFFWCASALVIVAFTIWKTRFGLRIFAIGANAANAARNGIPVRSYSIVCYVLCSLATAFAGIFVSGRVSAGDASVGASFALDAVTVIALGGVQLAGGVGSVTGVFAGTITLGLMTNGINLIGISPFIRTATTGVLLLLAISMQRRKVIGV